MRLLGAIFPPNPSTCERTIEGNVTPTDEAASNFKNDRRFIVYVSDSSIS
jgi:hypothetical protein